MCIRDSAVGDVSSVGGSSLGGGQVMDDQADGEAQEAVDLSLIHI